MLTSVKILFFNTFSDAVQVEYSYRQDQEEKVLQSVKASIGSIVLL